MTGSTVAKARMLGIKTLPYKHVDLSSIPESPMRKTAAAADKDLGRMQASIKSFLKAQGSPRTRRT